MATRQPIGDDTFDIRESYPAQDQAAAAAGWMIRPWTTTTTTMLAARCK